MLLQEERNLTRERGEEGARGGIGKERREGGRRRRGTEGDQEREGNGANVVPVIHCGGSLHHDGNWSSWEQPSVSPSTGMATDHM